ncbi:MAG: hypothetical protein AAF639_44910 [Chloroflexota bacterium]
MFRFDESFDFRRIEELETIEATPDFRLVRTETHFVVMFQAERFHVTCPKFYTKYMSAKKQFNKMVQERIGYDNASDPRYTPKNENEFNGFIQWHLEQDQHREADRDFLQPIADVNISIRDWHNGMDGYVVYA